MTTLNKIVYDIAHSQGKEDDESYLERLKFRVHQYRATIIRRDLDRNRFTPTQYIQTIGCLDMAFIDASSCAGVEVGCKVFRSVKRVPYPIRFKDKVPFYYVGTIDGKKGYSPITVSELHYFGSNKYTASVPRYYYDDGYIYLLNSLSIKIQVKGVFEYPSDLSAFNTDDSICYSDDDKYPISIDLARNITEAILNFDITKENPNRDNTEVTIDG